MERKTKGTNLKSDLLSPSKKRGKEVELGASLYFPVTFKRRICGISTCAHTNPVGRDKRPNLEAELRLGAGFNCLDVMMALGSKISVVVPSLCKTLPCSACAVRNYLMKSCMFQFLSYLQLQVHSVALIPISTTCAFLFSFSVTSRKSEYWCLLNFYSLYFHRKSKFFTFLSC